MLRLRDLHGAHDSRASCLTTHHSWCQRLARLLTRFHRQHAPEDKWATLDVYGDAGAPEGALLYVNNKLTDKLHGIARRVTRP
ncbi:hypothetical protein [Roseateles koreensis]|uniref:Uncharacterized protein n=1 Tax=Roseateles koreensis TaxID=2987526 RepID=A0ABT5KNQ9_9BURK|nr:hypothetical protein [Roseateles koreensis]MDC8784560.1 hypothetical protein [Roseateles koreensis]